MNIHNNLIPILCISGMLIGVLFSYVYPKGDKRRDKDLDSMSGILKP